MSREKRLTAKQEAFVRHYLANGGNGVDAARQAGYKGSVSVLNSAARGNLQKPSIVKFITAEREKLKKKTGATAEAKRELLWSIAKTCSNRSEDEAKLVDPKAAINAIAELNKMDGDLAAIKTDNKTSLSFEDLSDEELSRRLESLERAHEQSAKT